ncbi:MAG: carboxypeptidase-like regulatory domain-containing protein [Gemmatimonadetes bacterium]|jgi:hypothetical protein|nr:carboxypeptidase-like regulatory domain-containing protein [Gemmatimonadota bacterium]
MGRRVPLAIAAILALGLGVPLTAQDSTSVDSMVVRGEVLDALNGRPLVGVLVALHDLWKLTRTDELGYFQFEDVPVGAHELGVYGLGYLTLEQYLELVPEEILAITLDLAPLQLEGIEVSVLSNSTEAYRSFGTRYDFIGGDLMVDYREKYGRITDMLRARFPGVRVYDNNGPTSGLCVVSTRGSSSPSEGNDGCAMMMIDGLQADPVQVAQLNPEFISTIRYVTRMESRLVYGELGRYGLILIETVNGVRKR